MTEAEIIKWLGLTGMVSKLRPEIVAGMADVQVPASDTDILVAFAAFLKCAGPPRKPDRKLRGDNATDIPNLRPRG